MSEVHCSIDFETRSAVDLPKCGADVYARHYTTSVVCMAWAFNDEPVDVWWPGSKLPFPERLSQHVKAGGTVIAHNGGGFELPIWNHALARQCKVPPMKPEQMFCTMSQSYAMALPGSLDGASAAVGIDEQKDQQGRRIMLQFSKPKDEIECFTCEGTTWESWPSIALGCQPAKTPCRECHGSGKLYTWVDDAAKFERLLSYCKQDVNVERALHKRLMALSADERQVWLLDHKINQRGIRVDLKAAKAAIAIADIERDRLDREMRKVTGNQVATCNAVKQLCDWLKFRGVTIEGVAKADVLDALAADGLPADCRQALTLRQEAAKSSTKKLEAMVQSVCDDGRVRGTQQYHGAGTGRWSGRRLMPHNFPRPNMSQEDIEEVFKILKEVTHV